VQLFHARRMQAWRPKPQRASATAGCLQTAAPTCSFERGPTVRPGDPAARLPGPRFVEAMRLAPRRRRAASRNGAWPRRGSSRSPLSLFFFFGPQAAVSVPPGLICPARTAKAPGPCPNRCPAHVAHEVADVPRSASPGRTGGTRMRSPRPRGPSTAATESPRLMRIRFPPYVQAIAFRRAPMG